MGNIEFKYMPKNMWPSLDMHINHKPVYRAIKHNSNISLNNCDFIPSNLEISQHHTITFKKLCRNNYSVSLYTNLETLKEKIGFAPEYLSYAEGFTDIKRGVSPKASESNHVNYYLYDYIDNSPCDDFSIIEDK